MKLPSIIATGIYDSRIAVKNTVVSKNRKTTMFEIELPLESGGISYIDSNCCAIHPDMLICAKPNQTRHTKFPFRCLFIHMIIPNGQLADVLLSLPDYIATNNYETYKRLFTDIIRYHNLLSKNEEIILQSLILELIYTISKESTAKHGSRIAKGNSSLIEDSIQYIELHLSENITLEKIAKEMSLSPTYFHKTFKKSTGRNLHDFIEEQRIKKSINLLQTTNYSLARIAYECGFSSQSYFSYVFKRRMKQTPRKYLEEIYNKYEL